MGNGKPAAFPSPPLRGSTRFWFTSGEPRILVPQGDCREGPSWRGMGQGIQGRPLVYRTRTTPAPDWPQTQIK